MMRTGTYSFIAALALSVTQANAETLYQFVDITLGGPEAVVAGGGNGEQFLLDLDQQNGRIYGPEDFQFSYSAFYDDMGVIQSERLSITGTLSVGSIINPTYQTGFISIGEGTPFGLRYPAGIFQADDLSNRGGVNNVSVFGREPDLMDSLAPGEGGYLFLGLSEQVVERVIPRPFSLDEFVYRRTFQSYGWAQVERLSGPSGGFYIGCVAYQTQKRPDRATGPEILPAAPVAGQCGDLMIDNGPASDPAPVSLPASFGLLAFATGGLALLRRRNRP